MLRLDKVIKPWKESAALNAHINLYGFWNETSFLTKSGDVGMVLNISGVDYESLDRSEQEYAVKRLEAALKAFGPGFHVYQYLFKSNRPDIPFATYDDPVVEAAIDQRRKFFEAKRDHLYQVEIFYCILVEGARSKTGVGAALARLFRDPEGAIGELKAQFTNDNMKTLLRTHIERDVRRLDQHVQAFARQLADFMQIEILNQQGQFTFFRRLLNYDDWRVSGQPQSTQFLDYQVVNSDIEAERDHLRVGDHIVRVLTMKEAITETRPLVLDALLKIPANFYAVTEWTPLSADKARKEVNKRRRHFNMSKTGFVSQMSNDTTKVNPRDVLVDESKQADIENLGDCLRALGDGQSLGDFSFTIVLYGRSRAELDQLVAEFTGVFTNADGNLFAETYNQLNAYFATVPGNYAFNLRKLYLLNTNYADLSFLFTILPGEKTNPHLGTEYWAVLETDNSTPYFLNLHTGDVAHTLILGMTGSGKSYFCNFLLQNAQKYKPLTFIFDIGGSFQSLTTIFKGSYLNVGQETRDFTINPFSLSQTKENLQFLFSFFRVLIEGNEQRYRLDFKEERRLWDAIERIYVLEPNQRTISNFANIIGELKERLHRWTRGGQYGFLFDNAEDTLSFKCFQTFNFHGWNDAPEVLEPLLFYVLHRASNEITDPQNLVGRSGFSSSARDCTPSQADITPIEGIAVATRNAERKLAAVSPPIRPLDDIAGAPSLLFQLDLVMPIRINGPVTQGTRQNLINGLRTKPMSEAAVDAVLRQAADFTRRIAETYEQDIAAGEVGINGSAVASEDPIIATREPTTLMYGRVQSGKTAAMNLTAALCIDNGFRVVVVLTANSLALVEQTANRFKTLDGPRVLSTVMDDLYEWEGQEADIARDVADEGLVLVCAKDAIHLPRVIEFLRQIDAPSYPSIVFDDEADAATPDTTLAARSSGRPNAPAIPSTIHRRVVENIAPNEEGESISEILPHSILVQVTATPYLLFLLRRTSRLRPTNTFLLEPGEGYCGGEAFFAGFDPDSQRPAPPIVLVSDQEAQAIARRRVPQGLASSINFFLVAAAAKERQDGSWPDKGFSHLSHTSPRINQHTTVANHIERHVNDLRRQLRVGLAAAEGLFATAHAELTRTVPGAPSIADLAPSIYESVRQTEVIRVNSQTDAPQYGPRVNFLVGGNILGRGLTIDDLLVTYYIREAQTPQMDTVWQHARMYGYRLPLMPYTRVFLPRRLATRFKEIHESEEQLREILRREENGEVIPIRIAARSRATRPNATEPSVLQVYSGNLDQLTPRFIERDATTSTLVTRKLAELRVPIAEPDRERRTVRIPFDDAIELVEMVPIRDGDPGRWSPGGMSAIMESSREQYAGMVPIYVRRLEEEPPEAGWVRGRLSGPEIALIRRDANGVPALALMYLGDATGPTGWYPTMVMPAGAATYIVNPS